MKIVTTYVHPPIPFRSMDWQAFDSDTYEPGCPVGHGATEEEAIADFKEVWEMHYDKPFPEEVTVFRRVSFAFGTRAAKWGEPFLAGFRFSSGLGRVPYGGFPTMALNEHEEGYRDAIDANKALQINQGKLTDAQVAEWCDEIDRAHQIKKLRLADVQPKRKAKRWENVFASVVLLGMIAVLSYLFWWKAGQ